MLSAERNEKIKNWVRKRQPDLAVLLENIHDPHNIGAILRTCDAVGVQNIYVLYTEEGENAEEKYVGSKASRGTKKWTEVHFYTDMETCLRSVRSQYQKLIATGLSNNAGDLFDTDLTTSICLVLGNEHNGVSGQLLQSCDGIIQIPMAGMVQSLNVSVAAAVCLYEAMRQRNLRGRYGKEFNFRDEYHKSLFSHAVSASYPRMAEKDPALLKALIEQLGNDEEG